EAAGRLLPKLALHALAERAHLLEIGRRRLGSVEQAADAPAHRAAEARIAAHEPGARQRLALPRVGPLAVVALERVVAGREAAALGAGAQAQIHREGHAGRGDVAQE